MPRLTNQYLCLQKYRGLFLVPMILQTFATHFATIAGAVKVQGLQEDKNEAYGALALSVAAVSVLPSFSQVFSTHSSSTYVANLGGTSAQTLARRIDHHWIPGSRVGQG
jgi:hypothetical protein